MDFVGRDFELEPLAFILSQSAQIRTRLLSTLEPKLSRPDTVASLPQGVVAKAATGLEV